jgi:hypothetical protein
VHRLPAKGMADEKGAYVKNNTDVGKTRKKIYVEWVDDKPLLFSLQYLPLYKQ